MIKRIAEAIGKVLRPVGSALGRVFGPAFRWFGRRMAALRGWAKRRPIAATLLVLFLFAGYSGALLLGGVVGGIVAERRDYPEKLERRLQIDQRVENLRSAFGLSTPDVQNAQWHELPLNQHTLEWSTIRIGLRGMRGGALTEVGGHIVFASPLGRFNYLSRQNELGPIALQAPMNIEALRGSPIMNDPLFFVSEFRVHDLIARQIGPERWELYASYSRFGGDDCYQMKVSRAVLRVTPTVVTAESPNWEDIYTARPGCIPNKDISWRFQGSQAGGRMVFLDDNTMLVSVGDHQFDGFNDSRRVSMDPAWDLGKLIEVNLTTRAARIYAQGFRNPQGLVRMRDGRIFETEHGPQGGDEINFIREGANYGWPEVTYGMNYGFPRRNWPFDPVPGGHNGYTRPALAFVPSIGISNLVQPSAEEFPNWANDNLILASMRAGTLYHVAVVGENVAYTEPFDFSGGIFNRLRFRDLISMSDGRIVILTDSARLIFIRNADRHANEARTITVTGYSRLSAPLPEEAPPSESSPAERGRQYFSYACASCHSLDGRVGIGPPLNGVLGREVGAVEGFGYSEALSEYEGRWDEDLLQSFMTDPQQRFPGSTMPQATISWTTTPEIVAFLRTTRRTGVRPAAPQQ